jgi:hypothetical protein
MAEVSSGNPTYRPGGASLARGRAVAVNVVRDELTSGKTRLSFKIEETGQLPGELAIRPE